MEQPAGKGRTPSRCREWERNRRNKFNEAISRLGEIMREINRASSGSNKEADNVQYPKVEIVEKAILYLKNFVQETTQLKADILALQVKIESFTKPDQEKKDASTQVFLGYNRKKSNGKYVKVMMLQKSKRKALIETSTLTPNATATTTCDANKPAKNTAPKTLPTLLPKANVTDNNNCPENTIVVLPAAPYIFPQRPLLFPTAPPTFFLLDPNLQTLNKPLPIVNRNNGDVTKTTMVNILPISAYSRPLSASKAKRNCGKGKAKTESVKKTLKNSNKKVVNITKEITTTEVMKTADIETKDPTQDISKETSGTNKEDQQNSRKDNIMLTPNTSMQQNIQNILNEEKQKNNTESEQLTDIPQCNKSAEVKVFIDRRATAIKPAAPKPDTGIENKEDKKRCEKVTPQKSTLHTIHCLPDKSKENKLPNILDSSLCENVVDGGNARLELAEEFLAASPTAAFLMSFPLVSGNRADSPAEEHLNPPQDNTKEPTNQKLDRIIPQNIPHSYFEKSVANHTKAKPSEKPILPSNINLIKQTPQKYENIAVSKPIESKSHMAVTTTANENPFLNLQMPTILAPPCTFSDSTFSLDFDCNLSKSMPSQSTNYVSNNNIFYKSDPFSNVKSTIYSTSNISSGHEFNSFGLYPCAMEKYSSKNKTDYPNVEDNLMKIGSSRLTYDIDLGWSHKGFDFVNTTSAPTTFSKDNMLTTAPSSYSASYNPFNPEFHVPLVTNTTKKDNTTKPSSSFADTMTSLYAQPANLWSEDMPFYTNTNMSKCLTTKHNNFLDHGQTNTKPHISKQYESKQVHETVGDNVIKASTHAIVPQPATDKYAKKSQNKMHINWMTSETRTVQNNCNPPLTEVKEINKLPYSSVGQYNSKKHDHNESNYFPISMLNFPSQPVQEELQTWPSSRAAGTTEISIEPPPINLPTLVGDLALGPHDRKKNIDAANRAPHSDIQNCSNFFSVTQLMNRSTDNLMPSRYQATNIETMKSIPPKQNVSHTVIDNNRKTMTRLDNQLAQPCYGFSDSKTVNYDMMAQYPQTKAKANKPDKNPKAQKNSYSAEALIRGGTCTQKHQDSAKFTMPPQKYNDFNAAQDTSVAQVSHFPSILDYSENNYAGQQFTGTTLYNSTTNTISNSFYTNFMPSSTNLMSGNYTGAPFSGEFIDYNQTECNYTNKYDELKMRGNAPIFQQDKVPTNYKSSRREPAAKHKLECSKKESSKKYQNKRAKVNPEVEEWSDTAYLLWQNKTPTKRHPNFVDEIPFPNYVGNQVTTQYQPEFFNSHLMTSNVQPVGPNVDRSLTTLPATSRANFNLSTIFPEITMKVQ